MPNSIESYAVPNQEQSPVRKRVRLLTYFFIFALAVSGITAIPLVFEISILIKIFGEGTFFASLWPAMSEWITYLYEGIIDISNEYPFVFYGTDWLAFGHIVIAISFIGILKDPVKNIWITEYAMIACILVIPMSIIFGPIREIPTFWIIIDCSFGVFGFIPLWFLRKDIKTLESHHMS